MRFRLRSGSISSRRSAVSSPLEVESITFSRVSGGPRRVRPDSRPRYGSGWTRAILRVCSRNFCSCSEVPPPPFPTDESESGFAGSEAVEARFVALPQAKNQPEFFNRPELNFQSAGREFAIGRDGGLQNLPPFGRTPTHRSLGGCAGSSVARAEAVRKDDPCPEDRRSRRLHVLFARRRSRFFGGRVRSDWLRRTTPFPLHT